MKRFKEEARARGIALPSALTDLDPKTGKPAFLGVDSEQEIDAFVEQKKHEAAAFVLTPAYQQNTLGTQTALGQRSRRLQTEVPEWALVELSVGTQLGTARATSAAQTGTASVDSGVQVRRAGKTATGLCRRIALLSVHPH